MSELGVPPGIKPDTLSPGPVDVDNDAVASAKKGAPAGAAGQSKQSRKRTKTGCLTCRKRRIKCGEERPTCKNCVKSKRTCEGYVQRVIFKHPINDYGPGGQAVRPRGDFKPDQMVEGEIDPALANFPLAPLAPRAHEDGFSPVESVQYSGHSPLSPTTPHEHLQFHQQQQQQQQQQHHHHHQQQQQQQQHQLPQSYGSHPAYGAYAGTTAYPQYPPSSDHIPIDPALAQMNVPYSASSNEGSAVQSPTLPHHQGHTAMYHPSLQAGHQPPYVSTSYQSPVSPSFNSPSFVTTFYNTFGSSIEQGDPRAAYVGQTMAPIHAAHPAPYHHPSSSGEVNLPIVSQNRHQSVSSSSSGQVAHKVQTDEFTVRTFRNVMRESNLLATYHPLASDSPLTDPACARIFQHFIQVMGPSLSIFERHPPKPSALASQTPVPLSQQSLWTYKIPSLALKEPALLQAILTLSSLHMSKFHKTNSQQHLIHYSYAIQLLGQTIGVRRDQAETATLGATLLLGFYETMSALHSNWTKHLAGALHFINEIDYKGMAQKIKSALQGSYNGTITTPMAWTQLVECGHNFQAHEQLNPQLINKLTGRMVDVSDFASAFETNELESSKVVAPLTKQDIDYFQTQCDLAWWFKKQDVIQSLLSRTPLTLDFDRWNECLPRAGVGILRAPYGSSDHLLLILARLATFQAADASRKAIRQKKTGGQWVPPPDFPMRPPGMTGPPEMGGPPGMSGPPGMGGPPLNDKSAMPAPITPVSSGPPGDSPSGPQMPPGFALPKMAHDQTTPSPPITPTFQDQKVYDLTGATIEAEQEWKDIYAAFQLFRENLGHDYEPLPENVMASQTCPFGQTLNYRKYSIATLWMQFYMGLIILHRCHPSMPAQVHMATGLAAPRCREFANTIGQIACGLSPRMPIFDGDGYGSALGAALMDSTLALFYAGVQYMDNQQRIWTATKLRDTGRLLGWDTARVIAAGCEIAWERMWMMGKGPKYTAPPEAKQEDKDDERITRENIGAAKGEVVTVEESEGVTLDKRGRVHYAVGILGMPENLTDT